MALLKTGLNTFQPLTMAVGPDGALYCANGIDRPQRWDGQTSSAENAGIDAASTAVSIAGTGSGTIWGEYAAYARYVDDEDTPSNLTPIARTSIASGAAGSGFNYSNIPVSGDSRVTGRQLWRTAHDGEGLAIYLDAEIADNSTTTYTSTRTDGNLIVQSSMRMQTIDGYPNANRFGPPPDHMGIVACFRDRMWYAGASEYTYGSVSISGTHVQVEGARFHSRMVGRKLRAAGKLEGTISAVPTSTTLTLTTSQSSGFGTSGDHYSIHAGADERDRVYFSESGEPESFPRDSDGNHVNVLQLQQDGDPGIRALMPLYSYLFIFKGQHVYRLSTAGDPRRDAQVSLVAERGCINQRCWCRVEGTAMVMDEGGFYVFKGMETAPTSVPIQDFFWGRINWGRKRWFHCAHAPGEQVVRFFVALDNNQWPEHALTYNYRMAQWHLEQYPYAIGCSGQVDLGGQVRQIAGTEQVVSVMDEGVFDGCAPMATSYAETAGSLPGGQVQGTVDSGTATTIVDADADLDFSDWHVAPTDVGAPVSVIAADGSWQTRRIASLQTTTGTITVQQAFTTTSTLAGSTWQIGAVQYQAKFGTFSFLPQEQSNVRQLQLRFKPQSESSKVNLRQYIDHSTTAQTAQVDYDPNDGAEVKRSSENIQVDLTHTHGHVQWRFDDGFEGTGPAPRMLEVELAGVSGAERTKIYELTVDGVE
jgi:hypothetical protein